jgi:hypothetical protein
LLTLAGKVIEYRHRLLRCMSPELALFGHGAMIERLPIFTPLPRTSGSVYGLKRMLLQFAANDPKRSGTH